MNPYYFSTSSSVHARTHALVIVIGMSSIITWNDAWVKEEHELLSAEDLSFSPILFALRGKTPDSELAPLDALRREWLHYDRLYERCKAGYNRNMTDRSRIGFFTDTPEQLVLHRKMEEFELVRNKTFFMLSALVTQQYKRLLETRTDALSPVPNDLKRAPAVVVPPMMSVVMNDPSAAPTQQELS